MGDAGRPRDTTREVAIPDAERRFEFGAKEGAGESHDGEDERLIKGANKMGTSMAEAKAFVGSGPRVPVNQISPRSIRMPRASP